MNLLDFLSDICHGQADQFRAERAAQTRPASIPATWSEPLPVICPDCGTKHYGRCSLGCPHDERDYWNGW